ncbi:protein turtle homolog B-like [Branchiostoma lanceolatum]|uniref:protein turtle homolog B-like n=1 Tax=Branchiostoma lanceolatum TaxID=7740 RepID=UPI0034568BFE
MDCACVRTQPRWIFLMLVLASMQQGCHGNQGTPTVRTIRAMSGDTVTLPASYDVSLPVIAVTWNKLEGPESESTRVGVYMYSPRANGSLSMSLGPLKGRATLHLNGSLTVSDVSVKDEGQYVMTTLVDGLGQEETYVYLEVIVPPTVTVGLQIPLKVPVNTSVTLNCTVSKKRAMVKKVMWLKDGRSVPSHIKRRELEDTSHYRTSLEMWRVARQDMGNYTCVAQHVGGQVSDSLILDVTFPGVVINISSPVVVTSGMTAVLRCTADGNPLPDIRWHREGDSQEIGVTSPEEETTSRVILPDVHFSDSGWYWCVASNGVGQPGRQKALLSVLGGELSMPSKSVVDSLTWLDISIIAGVATGGASLVLTLLIAGIICARKRRDKPSYNTCQVVRITQPAEFMCRVNGWTGVCQAGDKNTRRCRAQVISSYYPPGDGGLHLEVGEVVEILHTGRDGWWYGYRRGRVGIFPAWCVQVIDEPEPEPVKAAEGDIEVRSTNGSSDESSRHASGQSSPARENGGNETSPDVEKPRDQKSKWPSEESVK